MKIQQINMVVSPLVLRIYKNRLRELVNKYLNVGALKAIEDMFGTNTIFDAIESIYVDDGYLCIPPTGAYSTILRYIQYGGPKVKSLCLLTQALGGRTK